MEFRLMACCRRLAHEHKRTRRVEADAAGGAGQRLHSHELRVVMAGTLDAPQTHVVVGANRDEAQQSRVRGQSGGRPSRGRVWALQGSWRQVRAGERDAVELTLHRAHDDAFVLRQRAQSEPHELAYLMRDAIGGPCVTIRGWQSVANRWRIGGNPWPSVAISEWGDRPRYTGDQPEIHELAYRRQRGARRRQRPAERVEKCAESRGKIDASESRCVLVP